MNEFEIVCEGCGAPLKQVNGVYQICSHCGSAPDARWIRQAQRSAMAAEYEAACEAAKEADDAIKQAHPDLKCPGCQSVLRYVAGRYENCPVCPFEPNDQWVRRQLYLNDSQRPAAELKHEFGSDEFVFEHPVGSSMPAGSAIIVTEYQTATYRTGSMNNFLEGPRTLPVSLDNRTEAQRLNAIAHGEQDGIQLPINTKLLFFDRRWKPVNLRPTVRIFGTVWTVTPELHFLMQIMDIGRLLGSAVTMTGNSGLADYLRGEVDRAVENAFFRTLNRSFAYGVLTPDMMNADVEQAVFLRLDEEIVDIVQSINEALREIGVRITAHPSSFVRWNTLTVTNTDTTVEHHCPNHIEKDGVVQPCSGSKRLPIGDHRRWVCPVCGATVRWCDSCNGYKHFDEADSESPNRFCRSCGKSNYN